MISNRTCGAIVVFVLIASVFTAFAPSVAAEDGNITDVRFHVVGPGVVGVDKTNAYQISLIDSLDRNWQYEVWVTAANKSGAFPTEPDKKTGNLSSGNRTIELDITATSNQGTMEIIMNVTSPSGALWYTSEEEITVVEPIDVVGKIVNSGEVKINNATVDIYIDDEKIGTETIETLEPGKSKDITAEWIDDDIRPGWHESRFEVDVNSDGVIDPAFGDIILTKQIYVKGDNSVVLYIMVGIMALLIGVIVISRKMKKK